MGRCRLILCLGFLTAFGGCTSSSLPGRPIVDMKGVTLADYETDLAECDEYAKEVKAGKQVAIGAAAGAAVGGLMGPPLVTVIGPNDLRVQALRTEAPAVACER